MLLPLLSTCLRRTNPIRAFVPYSSNLSTASSSSSPDDDFQLIYKNPNIALARFAVRLKLYQTGFTILLVPPYIYGALTGGTDPTNALAVTGISLTAVSLVFIFGEYFRRIIGMMYLDQKDFSRVKLSHLSILGKRQDIILPLQEFIPLSESGQNTSDIFWKVPFYDPSLKSLLLSTRNGGILEPEQFELIFGKGSSETNKKKLS